jgi:hypothetical protein
MRISPGAHAGGRRRTQSPLRSRTVPGGQARGTRGTKGTSGLDDVPVLHDLPSSLTDRLMQHDPSGIFV